ncbi:MAG: ImmA/IrrE family metallo-endopeptidase [Thermoanaerobacterium sp.]|nr:ImmA/IrrE family metallo-endopeptidase [Thermoanaerobacterium sp.]
MKILTKSPNNWSFLSIIGNHRKERIPKKPRKRRAKIFALEYLIFRNVKKLPINLKEIDYVFENYEWLVFDYEEAKSILYPILKTDDPLNIKKRNALARTMRIRGTNIFVTVYRKNKLFPRRDYYTLAHELGHIVLGHFFEFKNTSLFRGGLSDKEYAVLEREAEVFAAEFLMPIPVLKGINIKTHEEIMSICKVTKTSAQIRIEEFKNFKINQDKQMYALYTQVQKQFHNFIYSRHCVNCGYGIISSEYIYCPICGQKLQWGDGNMIYNDGYELDKNGRAVICPVCGNEEIGEDPDEQYCIICGTYLVNKCTHDYDEINNFTGEIIKPACGKIVPGNARYCPYCGSETTFFKDGILKPWQEVKKQLEALEFDEELDELPDDYEMVSEDDLPF